MPVYNVEKYLPKCLESLVNQTYPNMEIILVDDGSPDRCGAICDEYAEKYKNIRVIHQENRGVVAARNTGLRNAQGQYIALVDDDDFIELDMYEVLIRNLEKNDCDISAGYFQRDYSANATYRTKNKIIPDTKVYRGKEALIRACLAPEEGHSIDCFVWNKVYKRKCVENVFFNDEVKITDDIMFTWDVIKKSGAESVCFVDAPFYHYFVHVESASQVPSPERCIAALTPYETIMRDLKGTKLEPICVPGVAMNYIDWNAKICRSMVRNNLGNTQFYQLAKRNIKKYKKHIGIARMHTRIEARSILISWSAYCLCGKLLLLANNARMKIKSRR